MDASLRVRRAGPMTLIQDLGRPGNAEFGVSPSGALDRGALMLANRLVGNPEGTAGLEIIASGLHLEVLKPLRFAVTGAWGQVLLDGEPVDVDLTHYAPAGASIRFGAPTHGIRYYLALQGGVLGEALLGSLSTDVLSGLGPSPVVDGQLLELGTATGEGAWETDFVSVGPPTSDDAWLGVWPGPRMDWFADEAVDRLLTQRWTVSVDSNRVGARLEGAPLQRSRRDELPSEGIVCGAIQVPHSGLPTVFLADHPVTGGYPVVGVVDNADLDSFAQLLPGQGIRFEARGIWGR